MKLYTRTGDDGTTGLFGGGRVRKDDPRVEAYGAVDELNAALGLALAAGGGEAAIARLREILALLQSRLFDLGADLATPRKSKHATKVARIDAEDVRQIEHWIDEIDDPNPPMREFIMPGGTELAARLHLARTICRRAERRMITLARHEDVTEHALHYINRVSDLLFAMARRANTEGDVPDIPWKPKKAT